MASSRFLGTVTLLLVIALLGGCMEVGIVRADYTREKRWADQVVSGIMVGEPVYIEIPGNVTSLGPHKFLAIYTEAKSPRGGVVLAHGVGVHPDHGLIGILRQELAYRGYSTLSIQMPILPVDTPPDQYVPLFPESSQRLAAAGRWMQDKRFARVALVSHGMGSRMAEDYFRNIESAPFNAWVCLSISSGDWKINRPVSVPVLDVYADGDLTAVVQNAPFRAAVLKQSPRSRQLKISGTDHFYVGKEKQLADEIVRFLNGL